MTKYRAVIFDMDGTMVDNMRQHAEAWVTVAAELGVALTHEAVEQDFAGKKNDEILAIISPRPLSDEEVTRISEQKEQLYRDAYAARLAPMPGLRTLLESLQTQGIACAVASAAPLANRAFVLDGLALRSAFTAVIGAESVTRGKPFPDIFLRAAEAMQVEPAHCLVFEDAVNGVRAAQAAGMDAVGILSTTPAETLRQAGARWTASDFETLPAELRDALGLA